MFTKNNKWLLFIMLSLIWGSSFILMKRGLVTLNPYQLGSLRIIFAAIFLLIIGYKSISNIPLQKWKYIGLTSFFGMFLPIYLFAYAQTGISSSVSGILNSLTPLYTLILGVLAFGLTFKRNQIIGVVLGLTGCVILVVYGTHAHGETNYSYALLVIVATICYAINVNLVKKYLFDVPALGITTGNFVLLVIPALLILFYNGYTDIALRPEVIHSTLFIVILGTVGTGIANLIYYKLIQITSPLFASSVTYFIPIVAISWGLKDREVLNSLQFLGAFIILIGVYTASKK